MKRIFLIFLLTAFFIGGGVFFFSSDVPTDSSPELSENPEVSPAPVEVVTPLPEPEPSVVPALPTVRPITDVRYVVPFTSQAPTGEWVKSEFQNGCEEASVLIVSRWRNGRTLTSTEAKEQIIAMARFQEESLGHAIDTDVADTARLLLEQYAGITDYRIVYDFTLDDVKRALTEGLVIVPTNGRALGNPNFTRPGPLQHMLVITGYDMTAKQFITNDPGTRNGAGYRYSEDVLFAAISEYPTGEHLPIRTERKAMIIIPEMTKPAES